MRCRVTRRIIPVMHSMTKEEWVEGVLEAMAEMEDLVEVEDRLFVTTAEHLDTTHETIPTLQLLVSIASLTIMLLKNALFYKLRCRKREHRWEIRTSN